MSEGRITYEGSLDMSSVPQLVEIVEAAAREHQRVVLNMEGLDFVDSTGVRILITLRQRLQQEGRELSLTGFRQEILDIFDILGVRELVLGG